MPVTHSVSSALASTRPIPSKPPALVSMEFPAQRTRLILGVMAALLFSVSPVSGHAQGTEYRPDYKSIVVFGDSLSDASNDADLTEAKYGVRIPGPYADYTDGRFTDGADTLPAAEKYFGVWIEQYAATLPSKPQIKASLDGGTDYAYGFAFTSGGTSDWTFGPSNELSVNVNNIGQQITDYLATHPRITDKTLFVVWGGANDVLNATSEDDVIDAGINQLLNIQRLIDAGATRFLIPNLPPLGLTPRLNGSPTLSVTATEGAELYNEILAGGIDLMRLLYGYKHLEVSELDVYSLFNKIVAAPADYSLSNVTASSQGAAVDPDTYLFWDSLHPTTHGHNILAVTAQKAIAHPETRFAEEPRADPAKAER